MLIFKTDYQYWEDWKLTLDPLPRARFVWRFKTKGFLVSKHLANIIGKFQIKINSKLQTYWPIHIYMKQIILTDFFSSSFDFIIPFIYLM